MLLSAKPNPRLSAPCIHTSHSLSFDTHILCGQMFVWPLIEPDQGTDPAEKEHRKKKLKNHTIFFFFHWICSLFGFTAWACKMHCRKSSGDGLRAEERKAVETDTTKRPCNTSPWWEAIWVGHLCVSRDYYRGDYCANTSMGQALSHSNACLHWTHNHSFLGVANIWGKLSSEYSYKCHGFERQNKRLHTPLKSEKLPKTAFEERTTPGKQDLNFPFFQPNIWCIRNYIHRENAEGE